MSRQGPQAQLASPARMFPRRSEYGLRSLEESQEQQVENSVLISTAKCPSAARQNTTLIPGLRKRRFNNRKKLSNFALTMITKIISENTGLSRAICVVGIFS